MANPKYKKGEILEYGGEPIKVLRYSPDGCFFEIMYLKTGKTRLVHISDLKRENVEWDE